MPGERLPTEKELSRQFGVSVITVREALRALEIMGFIEKKKGRCGGIFASQIKKDSVKIPVHYFLASNKVSSRNLTELRIIIEPYAVRIATCQITPNEIEALEKNVSHCERKMRNVGHNFTEREFFYIEERNIDFHRLIGEATHNPVLSLTMDYIMDFLFSFKKSILTPDRQFSVKTIEDHKMILASLKAGNAEEGEKMMLLHIKNVENYLAKQEIPKNKHQASKKLRV